MPLVITGGIYFDNKRYNMSIKEGFKKIRDGYIINQVRRAKIPSLSDSNIIRQRITFSGRVQKIGFRLELCEMAKRLGLSGFCRNLENGDVLAEIQGPAEKIEFLISFMESIIRIKIRNKKVEKLPVIQGEKDFLKQ